MKLHYLPPQDHPVHRVAEAPAACNTTELLAALVGGPRQIEIAEELLEHFGSLRQIIQASLDEIAGTVKGIGRQTAARLISALELGKRLATESEILRAAIHHPRDIAALVQVELGLLVQVELGLLEQEELWVLLLTTRNRLIDIHKLYRGTKNQSTVMVGEIFREAIRRNAASLVVYPSRSHAYLRSVQANCAFLRLWNAQFMTGGIICHNHPSPEDVALTRVLIEASQLLDIQVLDHLVIGRGRWVSLKERGLGFSYTQHGNKIPL